MKHYKNGVNDYEGRDWARLGYENALRNQPNVLSSVPVAFKSEYTQAYNDALSMKYVINRDRF